MDGRIALFDMDGTLFDHDAQVRADLQRIASPDEIIPENIQDCQKTPWLKARFDLIRSQPGWWRNLPRLELGWQILEVCEEIGFCCHILTKGPRSKSAAWAEKVECITDHLGPDFPIDIMGKDKDHRYGRVLVDDYPKYLEGWLEHRSRGLGIMPIHPYNQNYYHPNVIQYRGPEDIPHIRRILQAVYKRAAGQHWRDLL